MLTRDRLAEVLKYNPKTGIFTRIKQLGRGRVGERAGTVRPDGGRQIAIDGRLYLESVLAHLWMTGEFPEKEMDHKNLDRSDNRWSNLRSATRSQNEANKPRPLNNTTGFKGVYWSKSRGLWVAQIKHNRQTRNLGGFVNPEAAHRAYVIAAKETFGQYSRPA